MKSIIWEQSLQNLDKICKNTQQLPHINYINICDLYYIYNNLSNFCNIPQSREPNTASHGHRKKKEKKCLWSRDAQYRRICPAVAFGNLKEGGWNENSFHTTKIKNAGYSISWVTAITSMLSRVFKMRCASKNMYN